MFEQDLTPVLQGFPDARVNFENQQGGGGGTGRAISIMLAGSDPALLNRTASTLVDQIAKVRGAVAPRIDYDLQRPELIINPRVDLAAQLGVTTQALSQAIRIATLGDIDQNAAKFSLSDRQIPIRVRLAETERRNVDTIRNLPVPTATGGSVPLSRVAEVSFGMGPTAIQRYNQNRRVFVGVDIQAGVARGDVLTGINNTPIMKNLPAGVSNAPVGADEWQGELIGSFVIALVTGILLVFSVLVLLYRRFVSPLVNMASLALAPLGGLLLLTVLGQPILAARVHRYPDAARHRRQEFDPAHRFRHRGDGARQAQARCHSRGRPQARPADRDDHHRHDRRHGTDCAFAFGRFGLAPADGHRGDRRTVALDGAYAADRARRLQPG